MKSIEQEWDETLTKLKEKVAPLGCTLLEVPVYDRNGLPVNEHYYALTSDKIGEGSFGTVYKAYPIHPNSQTVSFLHPMAVKICASDKFNPKEYEILKRYYKVEAPVTKDNKTYLVMEHFPGVDLFDADNNLDPSLQNLDFGTTLEVLQQICMAVNIMHHDTPRTGSAIVHCDIKGANVKIAIINGRIHVAIMDVGLADNIDDDPDVILTNKFNGSPYYVPLETAYQGYRGIKGDIFALLPIILKLLGANNPFRHKEYFDVNHPNDLHGFYQAKYDFRGLLKRFAQDLRQINYPIERVITNFLNLMQVAYENRPDSDNVLRFFTSLNLIYKLNQQIIYKEHEAKALTRPSERKKNSADINSLKDELKKHFCITALLSINLWDPLLDDFIDHETFQNGVVATYRIGMLDPNYLRDLVLDVQNEKQLIIQGKSTLNTLKWVPSYLVSCIETNFLKYPRTMTKIIGFLQNYSPTSKEQLLLLMNHCKRYNVDLMHDSLDSIFKDQNINVLSGVQYCLKAFIDSKSEEREPEGLQKMMSFWKYSGAQTIAAATKLYLYLSDQQSNVVTIAEQKILEASELAPLLKDFDVFKLMPEQSAKIHP